MPTIAIIGSLGSVTVYESGTSVACSMKDWEHVRLFSPVSMNVSPQGLEAIKSLKEDVDGKPALDMDEFLTGKQFVEQYLNPIYKFLIKENVHVELGCTVTAISKCGVSDSPLQKNRKKKERFRLLLSYASGKQSSAFFDYVVDATGTYATSQGKWLGSDEPPVVTNKEISNNSYQLGFFNIIPDVLGKHKDFFVSSSNEGVKVIVVGSGYSAVTTLNKLRELALASPGEVNLHVSWVTRTLAGVEPYERIKDDPLPQRRALAVLGNQLASSVHCSLPENMSVKYFDSTDVKTMRADPVSGVHVKAIRNGAKLELDADILVANVGFRPDLNLFGEVNMNTCWANESPKKLSSPQKAEGIKRKDSGEVLSQDMPGEDTFLNPASHFFIIGMKSYGRSSDFLMRIGIEQIDSIFNIIAKEHEASLKY